MGYCWRDTVVRMVFCNGGIVLVEVLVELCWWNVTGGIMLEVGRNLQVNAAGGTVLVEL